MKKPELTLAISAGCFGSYVISFDPGACTNHRRHQLKAPKEGEDLARVRISPSASAPFRPAQARRFHFGRRASDRHQRFSSPTLTTSPNRSSGPNPPTPSSPRSSAGDKRQKLSTSEAPPQTDETCQCRRTIPLAPSHRPRGPAFGRTEDRLQPVRMAEMDPVLRRDHEGAVIIR